MTNLQETAALRGLIDADLPLWHAARRESLAGPRILIATTMGSYQHGRAVDGLLALSLTLRRAWVELLLCDRALPLCQMTKLGGVSPSTLLSSERQPRCDSCWSEGESWASQLGLPIHRVSDFQEPEDEAVETFMAATLDGLSEQALRYGGSPLLEHAYAGVLRYLARADLRDEPLRHPLVNRAIRSATRLERAIDRLFARHRYDAVVLNHGIYIPQGLIASVAKRQGIRVVTWSPAYRQNTLLFCHDESYHYAMLREPPEAWRDLELDRPRRRRLRSYLDSRRSGSGDWIHFNRNPIDTGGESVAALGLDPTKPTVVALTNVSWDAQLHFHEAPFGSMLDWLDATIQAFEGRDDLQLIIRVHPAEVTGSVPSTQKVKDIFGARVEAMPNAAMVGPEDRTSTYALIDVANAVIIYGTKAGMEVACNGVPLIVTGEAWVRGKGFTQDATTPEHYHELLAKLPTARRLSRDAVRLAEKYAYHFFFRRMIPVRLIQKTQGEAMEITARELAQLQLHGDAGLDVIASGILTGAPFIYDGPHVDEDVNVPVAS